MTVFQCGHESQPMNYEQDHIKESRYKEWLSTKGLNGTKEFCLKCFITSKSSACILQSDAKPNRIESK